MERSRSAPGTPALSPSASPLRTPVRRCPRQGEALSFATPSRSRIRDQSAVALAGLRIFCIERFGGLRPAFERMDFHRDGHVSCLEFQEVLSGQERYCNLQEARELFSVLARGTAGWLNWEVFAKRLQGAWGDSELQDVEISVGPSESASAIASNALRSLLFGQKVDGISGASTCTAEVGSLASPSSGTPGAPERRRSQPREKPVEDLKEPAQIFRPSSAATPPCSPWPPAPAAPRTLAQRLFESALQESDGFAPSSQKARPKGEALSKLEESLLSLQGEVSTVKLAMGAAGVPCGQRWSRGRRRGVVPSSPPEGLQFDPRLRPLGAAPNCGRNDATTEPRWLRGLSQSMQGRLSACSNGAEAMKVLEEVVSLGTLQEAAHQEEASYEDVAAALALLQQAKDKVARLEALREERRKQHAAEAAELRKRLEKERRRSLRQLLLRLAPPGSAFARKPAPGLLTSPLPSPRAERAKKAAEVVEQGPRCFEPVTQAA